MEHMQGSVSSVERAFAPSISGLVLRRPTRGHELIGEQGLVRAIVSTSRSARGLTQSLKRTQVAQKIVDQFSRYVRFCQRASRKTIFTYRASTYSLIKELPEHNEKSQFWKLDLVAVLDSSARSLPLSRPSDYGKAVRKNQTLVFGVQKPGSGRSPEPVRLT
jgi:hypothetical protein